MRGRLFAAIAALALAGGGFAGGYFVGRDQGIDLGRAVERRLRPRAERPCVVASAWSASQLLPRLGAEVDLTPEQAGAWAALVNRAESPCTEQRRAGVSLGDCLMEGGACGSCVLQAEAAARHVRAGLSATEVRARLSQEVWQELDLSGAPALGPEDAPVVLVEWSDFQCPYCREAAGILRELRERHPRDLRVVWLDRPLESIHPQARPAALAARAAHRQGRFWEFHDLLFERQRQLDRLARAEGEAVPFEDLARELGLDVDRFRRDVRDPALAHELDAAAEQARRLGVSGTPTLFVGNLRYRGPRSVEALSRAITEAREAGTGRVRFVGALPPSPDWRPVPPAAATGEEAPAGEPGPAGASRPAASEPAGG